MKPTTTLVTIPNLSDSAILAKWQRPGEPTVVLKMTGVGNNAPYDCRAGDKSFIFRWSSDYQGHILRVPLNLWMQNKARLAHEIQDQRRVVHAVVALFEMPVAAPILPTSHEMGAADTISNTLNVVGQGNEPTVAPAVDWEKPPVGAKYIVCDPSVPEPINKGDLSSLQADMEKLRSDLPIYAQAYSLVEPPKRIKALAALLGVEESALRESIGHPDSKVELAAAGWVRRKS